MRKVTKRFIGLCWNDGSIIREDRLHFNNVSVIFEGQRAMGEKVTFNNGKCPCDYPSVGSIASKRKLNVVVGDPRILRNVRVVMRGNINTLPDIPQIVRNNLSTTMNKVIVFEDEHGDRIYADPNDTTLLSTVRRFVKE